MAMFHSIELCFKEIERLRTVNAALLEALERIERAYEQYGEQDLGGWFRVTEAGNVRAAIRQAKEENK